MVNGLVGKCGVSQRIPGPCLHISSSCCQDGSITTALMLKGEGARHHNPLVSQSDVLRVITPPKKRSPVTNNTTTLHLGVFRTGGSVQQSHCEIFHL